MAPDADKIRFDKETVASRVGNLPVRSLESLQPNEIAVQGTVYDLDSFLNHPGGDIIRIFGGMDATVQYHMIHPHNHPRDLARKMKVIGIIPDYVSEYTFDSPFAQELKRRVVRIVRRGRDLATPGYQIRMVVYLIFYASCQYQWIIKGSSIRLAAVYGISKALVGLNVQHDANHGSISAYPWINRMLGMFADGIGGSQWLWNQQHWTHHAFTNQSSKDPDAKAGQPFLVLHHEQPKRHYHRFQSLYMMFLFSLYWLSQVWNPSILNVQEFGEFVGDTGVQSRGFLYERRHFSRMFRVLYIGIHFGLPILYHGLAIGVLHSLVLGSTGSLLLSGLFSLSHNFEAADRHPLQTTDANGQVCWYRSQVETSSTYGGAWAGYLTGGLNYQIEHHLFPRMNSAWYPYISDIVREVCRLHNVRYTYFPSVLHNLASTFAYVRQVGQPCDDKQR